MLFWLYFWYFLKSSLFSSGGLANLPSLRQDLLTNGWAQETDFTRAIVISQFVPGFNGLWTVPLGYFSYGYLGATLALIATILPPFLVLIIEKIYHLLRHLRAVEGGMRGLTCAVIGSTVASMFILLQNQELDWRTLLIGLVTLLLSFWRRIPLPALVLVSGLLGYFLYQ